MVSETKLDFSFPQTQFRTEGMLSLNLDIIGTLMVVTLTFYKK